MKFLFVALVICFSTASLHAQEPVPSSESVLTEAYQKAAASDKKVFLIFHASWCGWCKKMDSALNDASISPLINKNFVVTHLTVFEQKNKQHLENAGSTEINKRYGGEGNGLPYWVILDSNGKKLADSQMRKGGLQSPEKGENAGCPVSPEELAHFKTVLEHTTSLSSSEIATVISRFNKINDTTSR